MEKGRSISINIISIKSFIYTIKEKNKSTLLEKILKNLMKETTK
jgi:hypothetical protein